MKIKTDKVVYGFNKEGVYTRQINVTEDPLIPGHFPPPANTTSAVPEDCTEEKETLFDGERWNERLKKTERPSKYHIWGYQTGWYISEEDQVELDIDLQIKADNKEAVEIANAEAKIAGKIKRDDVLARIRELA